MDILSIYFSQRTVGPLSRRIFQVIILAGFFLSLGSSVAAETAALTVETQPPVQPVYRNQSFVDSSPVHIPLKEDWQRLAVNRVGDRGVIPVLAEDPARITMSMEENASGTTVKIRVKSRPNGARLQLNGEDRGRTPWSGQVQTDTQVLQLKKEGFQSWQMELVPTRNLSLVGILERGADTRVIQSSSRGTRRGASDKSDVLRRVIPPPEVPVEPDTPVKESLGDQPEGSIPLEIESSPPGARIKLNGRTRGRTPLLGQKFKEGTVTITLEKPGYKVWTERIELNQPTRLKVKLRRE